MNINVSEREHHMVGYVNKCNCKFIYFNPTQNNTKHALLINEVYSMYIEYNNIFYCINTWAFLNKSQLTSPIIIDDYNSIIDITEPVYLLTYQIKNVGHTFVNLLEQIFNYFRMKLSCKIAVCKDLLNINIFIKSFINLFFDISNIIILESNQLYNFINLHFDISYKWDLNWKYIDNSDININKTDNINIYEYSNRVKYENDNDLLNLFWSNKLDMITNELKLKNNYTVTNKKICIIKNIDELDSSPHISNNNFLNSSFDASYITLFKKMGFEIINCSTTNISELINILNNVSILVCSWGCNAYLNKYLINNININILLLAHIYYEFEYNQKILFPSRFVPLCNKCKVIYNLKTSLNEQSTKYIVDSIQEME
jgi:hypothetical protein